MWGKHPEKSGGRIPQKGNVIEKALSPYLKGTEETPLPKKIAFAQGRKEGKFERKGDNLWKRKNSLSSFSKALRGAKEEKKFR